MGFQQFLGLHRGKIITTDGLKEFVRAIDDLELTLDPSTPYRPETNGVAERAVRKVKEGTSCALEQSGLSSEWWPKPYHITAFCNQYRFR